MKPTDKEIVAKIAEIDADDRFHYAQALVEINAPLALIQVEMQATVRALSWVLGTKPPKSGPRKSKKP